MADVDTSSPTRKGGRPTKKNLILGPIFGIPRKSAIRFFLRIMH